MLSSNAHPTRTGLPPTPALLPPRPSSHPGIPPTPALLPPRPSSPPGLLPIPAHLGVSGCSWVLPADGCTRTPPKDRLCTATDSGGELLRERVGVGATEAWGRGRGGLLAAAAGGMGACTPPPLLELCMGCMGCMGCVNSPGNSTCSMRGGSQSATGTLLSPTCAWVVECDQ